MTDLLLGQTTKNSSCAEENQELLDMTQIADHSHYKVVHSMHTNHNTPHPCTDDDDDFDDDYFANADLLQLNDNHHQITPKSVSLVAPLSRSDSNMSPSTQTHSHNNSAYRMLLCAYIKHHRNVSHDRQLNAQTHHASPPHSKHISHSLSLAFSTTNEIAWAHGMDSENEGSEDDDSDEWSVHTKSILMECEEELENASLWEPLLQNSSFYSTSNNSVSATSSLSDICLTFPCCTKEEELDFERSQKEHNALIRSVNIAETRAIGEDLFHKYHIQAWQRAQRST
eukprot:CAMPEP_0202709120 /NCGR_PEP_ID=MMETSP1385-20130828/21252_1 /ASSEMBLY_ACC=CAM_ASM_000861 /TAXON_ID=933848 /ORGANISM="Elphidium margaritaceum" /LENGTH=283 /DNA_ID=CAMNT_0049368285 /DNA_START=88 /DNA_END=939 /DNA_ORIENTATION=+